MMKRFKLINTKERIYKKFSFVLSISSMLMKKKRIGKTLSSPDIDKSFLTKNQSKKKFRYFRLTERTKYKSKIPETL